MEYEQKMKVPLTQEGPVDGLVIGTKVGDNEALGHYVDNQHRSTGSSGQSSDYRAMEGSSHKSPTKLPVLGTIALICAPIITACLGPLSYKMATQDPFLQMVWMSQVAFLFFLVVEIFVDLATRCGYPLKEPGDNVFKTWLDPKVLGIYTLFALGYIGWIGLFLKAVQLTLFSHAYILFNIQSPCIVLYRLVARKPVSRNEMTSTFIIFTGALCINFDRNASKVDEEATNILLGNSIAFCAGLCGIMVALLGKEFTKYHNPRQSIFSQVTFSFVVQFGVYLLPASIYKPPFNMDPLFGFFGWLQPQNILYTALVMGILCRSGTFVSYTVALFSYSIIVVTNAMMAEPLVSQVVGVVLGIDKIPGFFTFVGMGITAIGIAFLSTTLKPEVAEKY